MKNIFLVVLVWMPAITLAQECSNDGMVQCKSCSEVAFCMGEELEPYWQCDTQAFETCLQTPRDAFCISAETDCYCGERSGCLDDPYSKRHYIDCSTPGEPVYASCPEGLFHGGDCQCVDVPSDKPFESMFKSIKPLEACTSECAYNTSDTACTGGGTYHLCIDSTITFDCPATDCFDVNTCECAEADTLECSGGSNCSLYEVDTGDECSSYGICDTNYPPFACAGDLCYDPEVCNCVGPPTTTTTTTLFVCDDDCEFNEQPNPNGCSSYSICTAPDDPKDCNPGYCYDPDACGCVAVASTTDGESSTTAGGGSGTTGGGSEITTGDGSETTVGGGIDTTAGSGSDTTTPAGGGSDTTTGGGSGTTTTTTTVVTTTVDAGPTTGECLDCGFAADGDCGYIRCSDGEPSDCPRDTCFNPDSCYCEQ